MRIKNSDEISAEKVNEKQHHFRNKMGIKKIRLNLEISTWVFPKWDVLCSHKLEKTFPPYWQCQAGITHGHVNVMYSICDVFLDHGIIPDMTAAL